MIAHQATILTDEQLASYLGLPLGLTPGRARQRLSVHGNWPRRSSTFSAETAACDYTVLAAFQDLLHPGEFHEAELQAYLAEV